jgi:hypothetical protein
MLMLDGSVGEQIIAALVGARAYLHQEIDIASVEVINERLIAFRAEMNALIDA